MKQPSLKQLLFFAGLFLLFFLYASFYFVTDGLFSSPDETANFRFAQQYAQEASLSLPSSVDDHTHIHPRSVNVNSEGDYVPVSFLGLPLLYGSVASFLGTWSLTYLPILVALMGILAFYSIARQLFGKQSSLISAILLAAIPPWWYYSARGYLPNVTFLSMVLSSLALLLVAFKASQYKRLVIMSLSGLCLGLALLIRPIEFVWIALAIVVYFIPLKKQVKAKDLIVWLIPIMFLVGQYFLLAQTLYGNALLTGYDALSAESVAANVSFLQRFSQVFFPFGIDLVQAFSRFWVFSWQLLWPFLILSIIGLIRCLKIGVHKKYTVVFSVISLYLILYYGSWEIFDHPDASRISIGISYMRYWLPIYLLALPFVTEGILFLSQKIRNRQGIVSVSLIAFCLLWSGYIVYAQSDDNLGEMALSVVQYKNIQQQVIEFTEEQAVIISQRNDKVFWPQREVIHFEATTDFSFLTTLRSEAEQYPLYWYTELPLETIADIEQRFLQGQGVQIDETLELTFFDKKAYLLQLVY